MKLLEKTELSNTLKALIGNRPVHNLPATLNKDDIVMYNDYLYKCKNPGEYSIIDSTNFKPIGLRFRGVDSFKINLFPNMERFYYRMYQLGLNGDKQERKDWGDNTSSRKNLDILDKPVNSYTTGSELYVNEFISKFKKHPREIFPNNYNDRYKNRRITISEIINWKPSPEGYYDLEILKQEENTLVDLFNDYKKLENFILGNESYNFNYFELKKTSTIGTYENSKFYNSYLVDNHITNNLKYNENYIFGTYQKYHGEKLEKLKIMDNPYLKFKEYTRTECSDGDCTTYRYWQFLGAKSRLSWFDKSTYFPNRTVRYWLPNFDEIDGDDHNSNSARRLNRDFNHYGVFIKPKAEGIYKFKFKVVFTNRNQHEERPWGNSWGDRYAYYLHDRTTETNPERVPSHNKLRGNDTWLFWLDNMIFDGSITFNFDGTNVKNISINLNGNHEFIIRLRPEIRCESINNVVLLKVFYAIYSYDDAGGWNEWQFAHIIAPFDLEFEGE